MNRIINTGTPLYVTSSTSSGNYYTNNAYRAQLAQLQAQIAESFRQEFAIDVDEAERVDEEFRYIFRNYIDFKYAATPDTECDDGILNEDTSEELNEFLNTFKVNNKGVRCYK